MYLLINTLCIFRSKELCTLDQCLTCLTCLGYNLFVSFFWGIHSSCNPAFPFDLPTQSGILCYVYIPLTLVSSYIFRWDHQPSSRSTEILHKNQYYNIIHAYIHVHTHIHVHTRTHTNAYTHTCMHTHTHTHTHAHIHVQTHTHTCRHMNTKQIRDLMYQ